MRKIILSMLVLAGATTYAQVGINEESPKATLDISVKDENKDNDHLEGLLIPRVTKEKALKMANNSTTPPEESALIYVNNMTITSSPNATVEDITEKGYYFWNGAKWVKSSGANGELWAQRDDNGVTETYLKPADAKGDFVGYRSDKNFRVGFGDFPKEQANWFQSSPAYGIAIGESPVEFYITSDALPLESNYGSADIWGKDFFFNRNLALLKESHLTASPAVGLGKENSYIAGENSIIARDVNTKVRSIKASHNSVDLFSNAEVTNLLGVFAVTSAGSKDDTYNPTVKNNIGGYFRVRNYGISANAIGTKTVVSNYGAVDNMTGIYSGIFSQSKNENDQYPTHTIKTMYGIDNVVTVAENATVETNTSGIRNRSYLHSNSTNPQHYGFYNYNRVNENATVGRLHGARYVFNIADNTNIAEMYGLVIDNVNKGTDKNYAIYTNAGDIRFGDLVGTGERLVIANNEGVLSTSTASVDDFVSLWANDASAQLVKLKATSNGTARTSTSSSRNDVTISDEGKITARGFVGYNGATIFPDYVFEKYYKGYSNIKADYNFHNLASVESFIKKNGHLPGYKSAKEIAKEGLIDFGATQLTNIEKIEELYLHTIEQEKKIEAKDAKIAELEARLERLEKLINK